MKSLHIFVLIWVVVFWSTGYAEILKAAEVAPEEFETIGLVEESDLVLKDARTCLQEATALVQQLKNPAPSTPLSSSIASYLSSFIYTPTSPADAMLERINTSIKQLDQLKDHVVLMLRRATDAKTYAAAVEQTLRENMRRVGEPYTDPKKSYVYLLDPENMAGDVDNVTQQGMKMSAAEIKERIDDELSRGSTTDERKNLLRQLKHTLGNEVSKQEFDAYLNGTLATLVLNEDAQKKLGEQYVEILRLKGEIDEKRDLLVKIKGKSG